MKVGTDGVLLGAWVALGAADRLLLDVGTGTGVIALMLAQRSPAAGVTALDIDAACTEQARANADRSPWGGRVTTCCAPVQEYRPEEPFDLVVSNPPYYDRLLLPPDAGRTTARHTVALTHGEPDRRRLPAACARGASGGHSAGGRGTAVPRAGARPAGAAAADRGVVDTSQRGEALPDGVRPRRCGGVPYRPAGDRGGARPLHGGVPAADGGFLPQILIGAGKWLYL